MHVLSMELKKIKSKNVTNLKKQNLKNQKQEIKKQNPKLKNQKVKNLKNQNQKQEVKKQNLKNQKQNSFVRNANTKSLYKLFLGLLLKKGKMSTCQRIVAQTYLDVFKKTHFSMFCITKLILEIGGLIMEVRQKRRGKIIHKVPFPVRSERRKYLTLKNFIVSISKDIKKEKTYQKMSNEIIRKNSDRSTLGRANAVEVYTNVLKHASNAHYRWN